MSKELAEKSNTAVAIINYEDVDNSFDGVTSDCIAVPFLKVLQALSPECQEGTPEYIKDAKPGLFINSVTRELLGSSVDIIPCAFIRVFNRWADRKMGGGFKGAVPVDDVLVQDTPINDEGKRLLSNGDYLTDTRNHFVLVHHKGQYVPMVFSLSSTQIKKSKNWLAQMKQLKLKGADGRMFTPAMYSHLYTLESTTEKNDKGTWKGVKISIKHLIADSDVYALAREFAKQVKDNKVETQEPATNDEEY